MAQAQKQSGVDGEFSKITKEEIKKYVPVLREGGMSEFSNLSAQKQKIALKQLEILQHLKKSESAKIEKNAGGWKAEHTAASVAAGAVIVAAGIATSGIVATAVAAPIMASTISAAISAFGASLALGAIIYGQKNEGAA